MFFANETQRGDLKNKGKMLGSTLACDEVINTDQ